MPRLKLGDLQSIAKARLDVPGRFRYRASFVYDTGRLGFAYLNQAKNRATLIFSSAAGYVVDSYTFKKYA